MSKALDRSMKVPRKYCLSLKESHIWSISSKKVCSVELPAQNPNCLLNNAVYGKINIQSVIHYLFQDF